MVHQQIRAPATRFNAHTGEKLGVASNVLAKSLCHMLARIVTDRGGGYQNVSVAFPLEDGSNQRRPIIQASRPEREPD